MYPELVTRPTSRVPAADRRHDALHLRRSARSAIPRRSPAACTTSATAPTCSAPTSAPAGPISPTASRNASAEAQKGGVGSSSTTARKAARSARSPSSWSTTRASASPAATRRDLFRAHRMRRRRAGRMRFQQLMPDVLHWLGITRIDRFVSMSNMKYDALVGSAASRSASACRSPTSWSPPTPASRWRPRRPPATSRVASFHMFANGAFSRDAKGDPLRVDAERLSRADADGHRHGLPGEGAQSADRPGRPRRTVAQAGRRRPVATGRSVRHRRATPR
jgi:hypothetical protein